MGQVPVAILFHAFYCSSMGVKIWQVLFPAQERNIYHLAHAPVPSVDRESLKEKTSFFLSSPTHFFKFFFKFKFFFVKKFNKYDV